MSAASIIRKVRAVGVNLTVTPAGSIKVTGPRDAVARWSPTLVANKAAIIVELSHAEAEDRRAAVVNLLDRMQAENTRRRDWWREPVEEGRLTIHSAVTGAATIIELPRGRVSR